MHQNVSQPVMSSAYFVFRPKFHTLFILSHFLTQSHRETNRFVQMHTIETGAFGAPKAPGVHEGMHLAMDLMVLPQADTRDRKENRTKGRGK